MSRLRLSATSASASDSLTLSLAVGCSLSLYFTAALLQLCFLFSGLACPVLAWLLLLLLLSLRQPNDCFFGLVS